LINGLIAVIVAYLVGGIPFGLLIVRFKTGADVRKSGSGNIGATNVLRTTDAWPESSLSSSTPPRVCSPSRSPIPSRMATFSG